MMDRVLDRVLGRVLHIWDRVLGGVLCLGWVVLVEFFSFEVKFWGGVWSEVLGWVWVEVFFLINLVFYFYGKIVKLSWIPFFDLEHNPVPIPSFSREASIFWWWE